MQNFRRMGVREKSIASRRKWKSIAAVGINAPAVAMLFLLHLFWRAL